MREIKFRAMWRGRWFYFTLEDIAKAGKMRSSGMPLLLVHINESKFKGQFAGIKDKNGVEIYEGDICMVEGLGNCIVEIDPYYGVQFDDQNGQHVPVVDCIAEQDEYEVIGNIHQNQELLNEK